MCTYVYYFLLQEPIFKSISASQITFFTVSIIHDEEMFPVRFFKEYKKQEE